MATGLRSENRCTGAVQEGSGLARSVVCATALAALLAGTAEPLGADEMRCAGADVVVRASDRADAESACEGARQAIQFLAGEGLRVPDAIEVQVVDELPDVANREAVGAYLHAERRAYIIPFATFDVRTRHFGLRVDRSMYRSLAAHEVAHVVAAANFTVKQPNIEAQEYIAYVAQLATMTPELRGRVLALPGSFTFDSPLQINTAVYLADPERFGIGAYRHFQNLQDREAFLREVLAGRLLAFRPP